MQRRKVEAKFSFSDGATTGNGGISLPDMGTLITASNRKTDLSRTAHAILGLVHRLRIEELLKQHLEVYDINLGKIILIAESQRTGTTILHRLLNFHPNIRGVSGAEALNPLPPSNKKDNGDDRSKYACGYRTAANCVSVIAVHGDPTPSTIMSQKETVIILDLSFMSQ